jgi:hypothetical protein
MGPVSVEDNRFVSEEAPDQPIAQTSSGRAVFIFDLGRTPVISDSVASFNSSTTINTESWTGGSHTTAHPMTAATIVEFLGMDGRVLFEGNQVTFRTAGGEDKLVNGAVAIHSLDDVAIESNQVSSQPDAGALLIDVLATAATVRASGNRFSERPRSARYSYYSTGTVLNQATGNQATHCIGVLGADTIDAGNQVILSSLCRQLVALVAREDSTDGT